MGKYADLANAVVNGGEDANEVLKQRAAQREKTSSDILAGLKQMSTTSSGGYLQKLVDMAIGAGAGADMAADKPEVSPAAPQSAPSALPPQEDVVDVQSSPFFKAKFQGNYYLVPGELDGKPLDRDQAAELFVTGKLAPVAKSPSLDQIKKEEQRRLSEVKKEEKKTEVAKEAATEVMAGALEHELDAQQAQFLTNERAVGVMNKYSPAPDFIKNSEHGRMFMRGQAVDALGYLGMKMKNYALQGKELPEEDKKRLKEMEYVAGYKSPEDGSWTKEAAELVGQMYSQFTDSRHNPFVAGLVGATVGAAAGAVTGPGAAVTAGAAGLAAGTASAANRSALIEGGNFFLEARKWKHADGKPVTAREAAIATDIVGGVIGAMEVANVGPYLKMFPFLNKFVDKGSLVNNPAVRSIILKAAKRVAIGAGTEAAVETAQEIPGILAEAVLQDKDVMQTLVDPEKGQQLAEIFAKTFKGTAVLGGVGASGRMAVDSYDAYKQKRRERLSTVGVDTETTTPPPPKQKQKKTEPKPDSEDVTEIQSKPKAEEAPASAAKTEPEVPSLVTIPEKTDKEGAKVPASFIEVTPITTPAAVATDLTDGSTTPVIPPPASAKPGLKLEVLNDVEEEGFGTVQHEDGSRIMAPKRVWHVKTTAPIKLDWLVRPAILMNDNSIYEGPTVEPLTSATEPNIAKLDALLESRRKAEGLAIRAGYLLDPKNEEGKPVDVKDYGFVITGPEGTQAAGQPVWISSELVNQKYKGKHNSYEERLRAQLGENYEKAAKTQQQIEEAKQAAKTEPLSPEATELLNRPYAGAKQAKAKGKQPTLVEVAQKKVVKSLEAMGFDKAELESIVQSTVIDAARTIAKVQGKTPAEQQKMFFSRLRAFTADQAQKARQGGSRRQHQKMRAEGTQTVSLEAAGLENKPVSEGEESQLGVQMAENKVKTKVSANTPIKQAQRRAEFAGKEEKPGPVKVYTKEEIAKANMERAKPQVEPKQANSKTRKKKAEPKIIENTPLTEEETKNLGSMSDAEYKKAKTIVKNEHGGAFLLNDIATDTVRAFKGLSKIGSKTMRLLDVEHHWKKNGMSEIGFAIKNYFSRADVEEKKAAALAVKLDNLMIKLSGGKQPSQQYRLDVVLAAEDATHLEGLAEDYRNQVEKPASMLRKFMDDSQAEFKDRGVELNFKKRMLGDLDTKIEKETDATKKQELIDARDKVARTEFVHVPYRFIFQKAMRDFIDATDQIQRKKKLADFRSLLDVKRHTLSIKQMIEKKNKAGEYIIDRTNINPVNIILNYGANKGHDHALLDIRDALGGYKNVSRISKSKPKVTKEGYDWVRIDQPKLELLRTLVRKEDKEEKKKLYIRKDAFDALNEVMGFSEIQSKYDKAMALGKMAAFWNPIFLPMYNTMQSIRGMTINPLHPLRTYKAFSKAARDIGGWSSILSNTRTNYSNDYLVALENGLASKPFGSPFKQWRDFADQLNGEKRTGVMGDAWRAFAAEFKHASPWAKATLVGPIIKSMYMASWHTAWQIDELFRMASYNYLRERGHSPREAAQVSSALQGDYASVPPKTRKVLNKFLFTPTFKLATFKLYGTLLNSAMKVGYEMMKHPASYKNNTTKAERRYARAMIGVFMVNFAFDWFLTRGLGFERDEPESFGRRYRKRVVTAEGTTKDLYLTLASSENVLQRYAERVRKAFFTPGVENPYTEFFHQNRWELHPVYRNALSAVSNKGDDGQIWSNSDGAIVAALKGLKYFTTKTVNVLDAVQSRTEFASNDHQRKLVSQQWVKDFGKGYGTVLNGISNVFGYDYLADPVAEQMVMKLKQVEKRFRSEAYRTIETKGAVDPALVDWFSKEQQAVIKHYTNRMNEGKP